MAKKPETTVRMDPIYLMWENPFLGILICQTKTLHGNEIGTMASVSLLFSWTLKKGVWLFRMEQNCLQSESLSTSLHSDSLSLFLSVSKGVLWMQKADKFGIMCIRNIFKILKWLIRRTSHMVIPIYYINNIYNSKMQKHGNEVSLFKYPVGLFMA